MVSELVNNVTEPLNLPDWTPTFAIIVLIIGFPLALIFSWIFDVTPEGVEKTKPVDVIKEDVPKINYSNKKKGIYWGRVINWSITGILMIIVITYLVIRYVDFSDPVLVHKFSLQLPQGGTPEQLTTAIKYTREGSEAAHRWPEMLPGSKEVLYTVIQGVEEKRIVAYSMESGKKWDLIERGSHPVYLNSGHIVYTWKGDLLGIPFNRKRMEVTGEPFLIYSGVKSSRIGSAHFSISDEGSLVFVPGEVTTSINSLVLVDHDGVSENLGFQAESYQSPRISADGKQLLITRIQDNANLWIYGLERGTSRRFTQEEYNSFWGIWTPSGKEIVFNSNLYGGTVMNLFRQRADGGGKEIRLTTGNYHHLPKCWTKDNKLLLYSQGIHPETGMDIYMLPLDGDTVPIPLFNGRFNEIHPILSPDGRWIAYASNQSGRDEIFVSSFPDLDINIPISTEGGVEPLWAPDGKVIYFRDNTGDMLMKASFTTDPEIKVGVPVLMFQGKYKASIPWGRNYDLSPDGKQFLMIKEESVESLANQVNVILNWKEDYPD